MSLHRRPTALLLTTLLGLSATACSDRDADPARSQSGAGAPAARVATVPKPQLQDVLETTGTHIIGISYPPGLSRYPGLATQAQRYAEQARQQVQQAARQRSAGAGEGPFELSLEFKLKHESPGMVVLAVDGSSYTGGAHGTPMIQRWVWLPTQNRALAVSELFPSPESWKTIAAEVRGQLQADLAKRLGSDDIAPADRAELVKSASSMIEGGTEPGPEDFAVYEPVLGAGGRISALRFVFPPYQIGAYSEGMRTVELPASQLLPHVAAAYRPLFEATS